MVIRYPTEMQATAAHRFGDWWRLLLLALCLVAPATMANQIIAVGGETVLSNGFFDLACTDLTVAGVLDTGTGTYANVRNVTVAQSGVIRGTGSIKYSGTLSVQGTIQAGVQLIVNPPTNLACPGPPPSGNGGKATPTPTLADSMLVVLATLLLLLAVLTLRGRATPRHHSERNGAKP
jgi:hypothetical protein